MSLKFTVKLGRLSGVINTCEWCKYSTRSQHLFEKHLNRCKPPPTVESPAAAAAVGKNKKNGKSKHSCFRCEFIADKGRQLLLHQADVHGEKVYTCNKCDYLSRFNSKLKQHQATKHGQYWSNLADAGSPTDPNIIVDNISENESEANDDQVLSSNTKTNDQIKMNLAEILSDGSDSLPAFPIGSLYMKSMNAEKNTGQLVSEPKTFKVSEPKTFKAKKTCGNKKANKSRSKQPLSSSLSSKIPEAISKIPEAISKIPEATLDVPDDMKRFYEQIIVTETENDNEIALNKFQCEMCPFSTKHNEKIIRHLYLRHIQKHLIVKTESDESFVDDAVLYQCQLCSFRDGSKENVGCHFFQCHSDSVSVEPVPLKKKEETREEELSMPVSSTPKVYSCTDCLYTSTHASNFKVHRSHHVLDGPFRCDRCSYSSFQESAISRHLSMGFHDPDFLTKPSEKKKRKSKPKFTPSKSVLGKSVSPITASSPISRGEMAFLEKSVSGFTCHLCNIPFLTLRKLSRHIAAFHEGERAWKCLICGTTYLSRKLLRVHVRMKHERQVTSPNCGSSNISSPKVSPRPKVSSKVYTKLSTKKQRLSTESTPEGLLFPPKSKNLFRCYSCSYKADSSRNLHKHLYELHHSLDIEKKIENVVSSIANNCKKEYPCPLCDLVSKRKLHLAVHLRTHAKGRSNNTNCPWITAAKESTSNAQIDTSAQSDSEFGSNLGGKLYKKLGKSTKDKVQVKKTLHRCVYCRKSFMSKKGLNGHITRKHKNSKLFRCMYCVFASPKNYAVKRHIANRHPEKAVLTNSFDGIIKLNSPSNFHSTPSAAQNADKSNGSLNKMKETELSISNESVIGALGMDNSGVDSGLTDRPPSSGRKKFACDLCTYSSDCSNKLSCHKEIHTNYRRYKCPVCDRRSNWMVQIRYHIEKVHRDKNLSVRVLTDEEAQALDDLAKESQNDIKPSLNLKEDSKPKPASTEKNSFDDSDSTKQQKLKKVLKTAKRTKKSMETTDVWHGCSNCEYKSLYRWNIVKHIGSVHPGSKIVSIKSETLGFQRFRCNVCGLRSNLLSSLKSHAVRWHKHAKIEDLKSKQNAKPAKEDSISQPVLDSSLGRSSVTGNEMELDEYDRTIESVAGGIGLIEDDADKKVNPSSTQSSDSSVESVKITADKQTASDGPMKKFACSKCHCISAHKTSIHRHLRTVHSDGHKYEILTVTDEDIAKWDAEKFVYDSIDGNASIADGKDAGEAGSTESAVLNDSGDQKSKKVLKIHKIQKNVLKIFHKRQFNSSLHGNLTGAVKKNRIHVFKCTLCPLVTYNQYLFTKHKKNHVKRSDSKAECPYCPYFANSTSSIERHLIVHTDEYTSMLSTTSTAVASDIPKDFPVPARPESTSRPRGIYSCDECPYRANRDRDLHIHKQKHISRPHADLKCGYCTYAVRPQEKHHFQRHVRLHGKTAQIPSTPTKDYDPPASEVDLDTSNDFIDSAKLKHDLVAAKTTFVQHASDQKAEMSLDVFQDKGTGVRRQNSFTEMWLNSSLNVPTDKIDRNGEDWKALDDSSSVNCDAESSQKIRIKDFPSVDSDWHCERCPYAGNSLVQFNNHISLHNSKQKYECEFCDYSVSRYCHLLQHRRLHLTKKNPNLLSAQTVTSLQQLPRAETIVERQLDDAVNYGSLFENSSAFTAPIKLFRCVHCPFSSSHRMNFVKHLKGHQISSQHRCPYCTYSVSDKQQLIPHIRDHFNLPGSEMNAYTDDPAENSTFVSEFMKAILEKIGILSKSTEDRSDDVKPETNDEASKETVSSFKSESSVKLAHPVISEALNSAANFEIQPPEVDIESKNNNMGTMEFVSKIMESVGSASSSSDTANIGGVKPPSTSGESSKSGPFICQYCDRYCNSASHLVAHESAHLIGCGYLQMRHV